MKALVFVVGMAALFGGVALYQSQQHERAAAIRDTEMAKLTFMASIDVDETRRSVDRLILARTGRLDQGSKPSKSSLPTPEDAERAFMQACSRCAAAEACERDRLVIRGGAGSEHYNPCN